MEGFHDAKNVYKGNSASGTVVATFTTDANGHAELSKPLGNGTLAGAWYGMFLDDELVDRYQTDAEGKYTTKEYICGYNWELREIDPSEGYLLDEESHHVPAEPNNFAEEHNPIDMTVTEQVKRGGVLIEKRDLESKLLTPLGGASLDGTLFEITNKSKNAVYVDGALYEPQSVVPRLIRKGNPDGECSMSEYAGRLSFPSAGAKGQNTCI